MIKQHRSSETGEYITEEEAKANPNESVAETSRKGLLANEYQKKSSRTLLDRPDFQITEDQIMLAWNTLGLAGETGEVVELAKKQIFHQQGLDVEKWKKELGDVMWYVSACCSKLGLTLEEVMQYNIAKLEARFPNGYNAKDSTNRVGMAD